MNIIVSACLLGINSKYNGGNNYSEKVELLSKNYTLIPVCPEQLGGLSTPRYPAEIKQGSDIILNSLGQEVTLCFKKKQEALKIALLNNCKYAILKSKVLLADMAFFMMVLFQIIL